MEDVYDEIEVAQGRVLGVLSKYSALGVVWTKKLVGCSSYAEFRNFEPF